MVTSPSPAATTRKPQSVFQRRWRKFRTLKRGWYSFLLLFGVFFLTALNPLLINNEALIVRYQGQTYFPAFSSTVYQATAFGQRALGEVRYRELKTQFAEAGGPDWLVMPPYPYSPTESLLKDPELVDAPPNPPSPHHWMGTDDRGRDVFARLIYGFRISMSFGLMVTLVEYVIGIGIGSLMGYFGGRVDILGSRLVEIWSGVPFLYTVIIVSSIVHPNLLLLVFLLAIFQWVAIFYYMRGEFYREKARDYVAAAVVIGESPAATMFRHLLPNTLTPVVSFAPFSLVASIISLVSLDFLGFGLPPPTPSWGELVFQGLANITSWHLVLFPLGALFLTLMLVVFIGEAVREAFNPKTFARLR